MCSFQLLMGKVYKYYPVKPVFVTGVVLFEVGSAICGAAPNSVAFIIGRAISGLGSSGMFSGAMVIIFHIIPLQQRPMWQGGFGAIFALASVIGPLVGGAFTDKVTWRWCFYINLPIGAVSIFVTLFILNVPDQKLDERAKGFIGKIKQLDPIGSLAFFPGIICLVLALQWGGTKYAWKDARIIALLVVCGVLCIVFTGIQIWKGEAGTVPPRIVKQRSMAAAIWFCFFAGAAMMVIMYYLPIWFQAVKGVSAIKSGIMLLPMVISTVISIIVCGVLVSKTGYYTPFFILSSILMPIGAGLLATFTPETAQSKWIGFQVLLGVGFGMGSQQQMNVVQTVFGRSDIAVASAIIMFVRFLGSAIFLPVAQNVFLNSLVSKLTNLPNVDAQAVINGGATSLTSLASGNDLSALLADYNSALINVFYLVVATSAVTLFGSIFVEWKNLKATAKEQQAKNGVTKSEDSITGEAKV